MMASECVAWGQPSPLVESFDVLGNVIYDSDGDARTGVSGIRVTVVSDNEVQSVCTDAEGRWRASVTTNGDVVAFLDPAEVARVKGVTARDLPIEEFIQRREMSQSGRVAINFFIAREVLE